MEDESQHFVGKVAHKALIERDGKVLLARPTGQEYWDIPGGRIHVGERPAEAVAREVKEELGLDVTVGAPFFADLITATLSPEVRYFICFHVTLRDPRQEPTFLSDEATKVLWVSCDEVETVKTFEVCRDALKAHFAQHNS